MAKIKLYLEELSMFNKKKLLHHKKGNNPYGLHDKYGRYYSKTETIEFFNKIKMTDEELDILNEYIKENDCHSFYDNVFTVYDDCCQEMDFINGLRFFNDMTREYESRNRVFTCHSENNEWNVKITDLEEFNGYIKCNIICNGNIFYTYTGMAGDELWICFPHIDKATTLSHINDALWNTNELYRLLKNEIDALSIAYALIELKQLIDPFDLSD